MRVIFSNGSAVVTDDEQVLERANDSYRDAKLDGYNTNSPSLEELTRLFDKALYTSVENQQRLANEYKFYKELFLASYENRD